MMQYTIYFRHFSIFASSVFTSYFSIILSYLVLYCLTVQCIVILRRLPNLVKYIDHLLVQSLFFPFKTS